MKRADLADAEAQEQVEKFQRTSLRKRARSAAGEMQQQLAFSTASINGSTMSRGFRHSLSPVTQYAGGTAAARAIATWVRQAAMRYGAV